MSYIQLHKIEMNTEIPILKARDTPNAKRLFSSKSHFDLLPFPVFSLEIYISLLSFSQKYQQKEFRYTDIMLLRKDQISDKVVKCFSYRL